MHVIVQNSLPSPPSRSSHTLYYVASDSHTRHARPKLTNSGSLPWSFRKTILHYSSTFHSIALFIFIFLALPNVRTLWQDTHTTVGVNPDSSSSAVQKDDRTQLSGPTTWRQDRRCANTWRPVCWANQAIYRADLPFTKLSASVFCVKESLTL